jgi:hypothetical protein
VLEHGLPDCRWTPCYDCGVCTDYALEHVVASAVPPAGGSQGTGQGLGFGREVSVELITKHAASEASSPEQRAAAAGVSPAVASATR